MKNGVGDESPRRAAGYCRVSTDEQAREGLSLQAQEERLREAIERDGYVVREIYVDAGISARSADKRPALQRMLRGAAEHDFDMLYIPAVDRLCRNTRDLIDILANLERQGVGVKSLRGDVETSNATGRAQTQFIAVMAELESNLGSERTAAGKKASAAKGRRNGGPRPFGYSQAGGMLTVVPHEADVLHRIRNDVIAGKSMSRIARELNQDRIATARGAAWSQSRVSQTLKNSLYAGRVRYRDTEHNGLHTPIFDGEQWDELQSHLQMRRRAVPSGRGRPTIGTHLFIGQMLRCGSCGASVVPRTTTNKQGRVYELYRCLGQLQGSSPGCTLPGGLRREPIDSAVLEYFEHVGLDVEATLEHFSSQGERRLHEARTLHAQAEMQTAATEDRLARVKRDYYDGNLDAAEWREHREELQREREAAVAEADRLRKRADDAVADGVTADAEVEALAFLADLRDAIGGRTRDPDGITAIRASLLRVFAGFSLHSLDEHFTGGPTYWQPELLLPGALYVEPHPHVEAVLDADATTAFPEVRKTRLVELERAGEQVAASGR